MCARAEGKGIDPCIRDLVAALNAGGVETVASCCGHGERPGSIILADGRELYVLPWSLDRAVSEWSSLVTVAQLHAIQGRARQGVSDL